MFCGFLPFELMEKMIAAVDCSSLSEYQELHAFTGFVTLWTATATELSEKM